MLLTAKGIWDVVNYNFVPWGNAYYNSSLLSACPGWSGAAKYERGTFPCWAALCNTTNAPTECFTGEKLCQHTDSECAGDTIEACAKYAYPSPTLYAPFIYCLEGMNGYYNNSIGGVNMSMAGACATQAGLDVAPIQACYEDKSQTNALDAEAARATARAAGKVPASDWGTPYVVVNGEHLDDTSQLLSQVCGAWAAQDGTTLPEGCPGAKWHVQYWWKWQEGVALGVGAGGMLVLVLLMWLVVCCCCPKRDRPAQSPLLYAGGS